MCVLHCTRCLCVGTFAFAGNKKHTETVLSTSRSGEIEWVDWTSCGICIWRTYTIQIQSTGGKGIDQERTHWAGLETKWPRIVLICSGGENEILLDLLIGRKAGLHLHA
jgi:hypothetical protein